MTGYDRKKEEHEITKSLGIVTYAKGSLRGNGSKLDYRDRFTSSRVISVSIVGM